MINFENLEMAAREFKGNFPFDHMVVDNFFDAETASALEQEFPDIQDNSWHNYHNAIEVKKLCNNWNAFPAMTYKVFSTLNSPEFVARLGNLLGIADMSSDPGLNGGGWHIHGRGGKLNTHLDYSLHPKLRLQRKLNIIIYINSQWQPEWGGQLGLWTADPDRHQPQEMVKSVDPVFNRAVIFDTTQNSWHGLPSPLTCPAHQARKSLAVYYLHPAAANVDTRGKALFAPTPEQAQDPHILELIRLRSNEASASSVYNMIQDVERRLAS